MGKPQKYMRKPFEVDVVRWDGTRENAIDIVKWIRDDLGEMATFYDNSNLEGHSENLSMIMVITDAGQFRVFDGGYVVSEGPHDITTCTPQEFHRMFESRRTYRAREKRINELKGS